MIRIQFFFSYKAKKNSKCPALSHTTCFRTWIAFVFGVTLAVVHTVVSVLFTWPHLQLLDQWQQVVANLVALVAVNLAGLFIHNLTEEGQRRAFLDTRNCIAARLEMEDENEKLVGLLSKVNLFRLVSDSV